MTKEEMMRLSRHAAAAGIFATCAGWVLVGSLISSPRVHANDNEHDGDELKVAIGFEIAPVSLNLNGKNPQKVGLGSYIVNGAADCNGCHTADPTTEYTNAGNPYLLRIPKGPFTGRKQPNPATYLGGGSDFGPLGPPPTPHIISRNLTPDKTGMPEGGHTYAEFHRIMRTGIDLDHLHPTCPGPPGSVGPNCLPVPFNGALLQVMPWPNFQNMTDRDLEAIYEYLSAIPCIAGPPSGPLHNDCH
jgi:hypothetical protein